MLNGDLRAQPDRAAGPEAVAHFLEQFRVELLHQAHRALAGRLRAKVDPADLVQETLIRANAAFGQFRGATVQELTAWLRGIMDYALAEYLRQFATAKRNTSRERPTTTLALAALVQANTRAQEHGPSSLCSGKEEEERLRQIVDQLPTRYRHVLLARHWDNKTFAQIGQDLGMTRPGVRKLYDRALAEVRRHFQGMLI